MTGLADDSLILSLKRFLITEEYPPDWRSFERYLFKRLHHFAAQMAITPFDFAARLDRLLSANPAEAAVELERLVGETIELVTQHMPQVNVNDVQQKISQRKPSWKFAE
jgi:hypothetical protein